ncbi:MAG: hypothetical protein FJW26_21210 [Acidimicrobiia bacterium]|nr:hypothetical protein [Acidimicrobiia bacterium]
MKYGKLNLIAGAAGILVGGIGGLALGVTFDKYSVKDGHRLLRVVRFYLCEGHSHGMPIALFNFIVGFLIDRLPLSPSWRRVCPVAAVVGLVLPIGLALKGASGAAENFPPVGLGIAGMRTAAVLLLVGAVGLRTDLEPR